MWITMWTNVLIVDNSASSWIAKIARAIDSLWQYLFAGAVVYLDPIIG